MLAVMQQVYRDTESMMQEVYELNPVEGVSYNDAKENSASDGPPPPCAEQLELSLSELHGYTGADGGRILFSLAGELLDVSSGAEMYSPGTGYSMLAGRDVTRCLGTMSLDPAELDDLRWEPDNAEEEKTLAQWREKLKVKYPVAGRLSKNAATEDQVADGLRRRKESAAAAAASTPAAPAAADASGESQKCPISGKEGAGCPLATMGILPPKPKAKAKAKVGAASGFMAGKSLIAATSEKEPSYDDWWLSKICPLHWDKATAKAFLITAAVSWLCGVGFGYILCRLLRG